MSVLTVARELGHTSTDMVERIYLRLGEVRHRAAVVEFEPAVFLSSLQTHDERAAWKLAKRLDALAERAGKQANV